MISCTHCARQRRLGFEPLEARQVLSVGPLITEFLASNDSVLADGDGDFSDWIEIHNPTADPISLDGWYLTDDDGYLDGDVLDGWQFPAVTLDPGDYLVVFASGKDRRQWPGELHTDFQLDGGGEYLALVRPDGVTPEWEFSPTFPGQRADISYGVAPAAAETLVAGFAPAKALVPTNGDLGSSWTEADFNDTGWTSGTTGVGYENGTGYEPLLGIDLLGEMYGINETAYVRIPFTVDDPAAFDLLTLRMKYDDGFMAYINGELVASRNPPADVTWHAGSPAQHSDSEAVVFVDIDISDHLGALRPGGNVLAIQGLNNGTTSSDLLILPELIAGSTDFAAAETRYFTVPTPGGPNGEGILGFVADTQFSVDRGFHDAPFSLAITTDTPGATIRYTTDGSQPTETHGTLYAGPFTIETTATIRAFAYLDGYLPTNVDTHTYIFVDDVIEQPADVPGYPRPTVNTGKSQSVTLDYEMDPNVVDDPAYSGVIRDAMLSIPTISLVMDEDDMFDVDRGVYFDGGGSSSGPEAPLSVEILYPGDPGSNFQAEAGVRPHSHQYVKRSFRLVFRTEYGDAKLEGDVFAAAPLYGDTAAETFDRLVLRAGGNRNFVHYWNPDDTTYTRDEWARASQIAMSGVGSHGDFVHLYINGLYFGLYNLVERPDHFFMASYYGGDQDDYFAVNHGGTINGDASRWNYLKGTLKNKDMSALGNYEELRDYLDVEQFADYVLLNLYAGTDDWPTNNWYGGYYTGAVSGGDPGPMRFFVWDAEDIWDNEGSSGPFDQPGGRGSDGPWITPELRNSNTKSSNVGDIARIFHSLRDSDEFMLLFADRAYEHLFNDGALTDENSQARWDALNDYVRDAIVAESARWGDARETLPGEAGILRTRDGVWQAEADRVANQSIPGSAVKMIQVLRNEGYYPSIDPPLFSQHGGTIEVGFPLRPTNPNAGGTIYYTLDGTDPRAPGGGVAPGALVFAPGDPPIELSESTRVKARVLSGGEWSALADATFLLEVAPSLRITEIMYNPADPTPAEIAAGFTDNDSFEFIEIQNIGTGPVNLEGVAVSEAIDFVFGNLVVDAGQHVVVVQDAAAFQARYGDAFPDALVAGQYKDAVRNNLSNSGERVRLAGRFDETILDFEYNDSWYDITDGSGFSLVVIDPYTDPAAWGEKGSWRASGQSGGSPGTSDSGIAPGTVVINEVLSHTDGPDGDWIELYNTTDQTIDGGGWFLSDDPADLQKYRIADGTEIPGGDYLVFTQAANFGVGSSDPGALVGFGLSELGDEVYLSSAVGDVLTGYRAEVHIEAADKEVSFGRYVKSTGADDFTLMSQVTPGEVNAAPRVGPIVINELMYNPAAGGDEFIELYNATPQAVPLYDPVHPENTWQLTDGITFAFPSGAEIPSEGFALIVPIDPSEFRSKYGIAASVPIFGPYAAALSNGGENVELSRPGEPEPDGTVPMIRVDRVSYKDEPPWYPQADGGGSSLSRLSATEYGNDVANWAPSNAGGTPGAPNQTLDVTPPTVPEGLTAAVPDSSRIIVSWDASVDPETGVAFYRVFRNSLEVGTTSDTSFSDTTVTAATLYSYRVAAVNGDGAESGLSSPLAVAVMTMGSATVSDANHVQVAFSEAVETASAEDPGNYAIGGITVLASSLQPDDRTVVLATSTLEEDQTYTLAAANIVGMAGGILPPGSLVQFTRSSRVTDGLLALYDLEEGSGATVHDVSQVGAPLDLSIDNPAAVTWIDGGLSVDSGTIVASAASATKIIDAVRASGEISVEAWVQPATTDQSGPARIVTLSVNPSYRNFTLGQQLDTYDFRLRTTATSTNGIPSITSSGGAVTTELTHIVYTRDAGGAATIYVNGAIVASGSIGGQPSNWDSNYRLGLANEFTLDRTWRGEIHLVAVYDQALSANEVSKNFLAGADTPPPVNQAPVAVNDEASTDQDAPVAIDVLANDFDFDGTLDAATVSITEPAAGGTLEVDPATGVVTYTPDADFSGTDTFRYTVRDDDGAVSNEATVTVAIHRADPPPSLDVDDNGTADALTDGILILRYLFGFTGQALIDGAISPSAARTDPAEIAAYLHAARDTMLDADLDGDADALTDGILILRYLFGFSDRPLIDGALGPDATRTDAGQIEGFLDQFHPGVQGGSPTAPLGSGPVEATSSPPPGMPTGAGRVDAVWAESPRDNRDYEWLATDRTRRASLYRALAFDAFQSRAKTKNEQKPASKVDLLMLQHRQA